MSRTVAAATLTPSPPGETETHLSTGTGTNTQSRGPAVGPLAPGDAFSRRYRILNVLGAGGMGVVYHAWDDELGMAIALKVIRPEVMDDPYAAQEVERRFKRELVLARQVTHRNVVRIHDLGDIDGIKYLTMPFIEGENLASRLIRGSRIPMAEALRIARQIASGLEAAHAAGVVHRDLKPENVMIEEDGHAIIMDFGISRSMTGTGAGTMLGAIVGTLEYMSPEQSRGEPADHRSDIYSLGLILYDMIGGRRRIAASGGSAVAEMMTRVTHPPPVRSIDPHAPEAIDRLVTRCLEPDPQKRYQSTADLLRDLEGLDDEGRGRVSAPRRSWVLPSFAATWPNPLRVAVAVALAILAALPIAVLIAIVAGDWLTGGGSAAPREPVSVIIADFDNQAKDPIFESSLEQALGIAIEGASFIGAYPRGDALKFVQQTAPGNRLDLEHAQLVAKREGIKIVLAGSIAPSGSGYDIVVRAIDAFTGSEVARAREAASTKADVLQAVGELASDLRTELGDTTPAGDRASAETFTAASLEAASAYSRAQDLAAAEKHEEAIGHYQRATTLDPNFGRAYSGWALSADKLGRKEEAAALFKQALQRLDRMTEREKFRTLGVYYSRVERNYEKAIENNLELVRRYPGDGAGWNNLAVAYFRTLDFPKAFDAGGKALAIYPNRILYRSNFALYAMYASDFVAATREAKRIVADEPSSSTYAYLPLAMAAMVNGDDAGVRAAYAGMAKTGGVGRSLSVTGLADLALYEGKFAEAEQILLQGIAVDERNKNTAGLAAKHNALAEAQAGQGRTQAAVASAQSALKLATDDATRVPAARLLVHLGRAAEAGAVADMLGKRLQPISRAYGQILAAELALRNGQTVQAVEALLAARKLADLWLGRYLLGVAYVSAGGQDAAALSELETAEKRKGEITAAFPEDVPSFRYHAPVSYWLARAQEGVGLKASAFVNYKKYLALRKPAADPLAADAERRLPGLR